MSARPRRAPTSRRGIVATPAARIAACLLALTVSGPATALAQDAMAPPPRAGQTLDLEGAIRTGLSRNPSVESADANAAAAQAARWADWGAFIPDANLNINLSQTGFTTVTFLSPEGEPQIQDPPLASDRKRSAVGLSFSWDIFRGGQNIEIGRASCRERV